MAREVAGESSASSEPMLTGRRAPEHPLAEDALSEHPLAEDALSEHPLAEDALSEDAAGVDPFVLFGAWFATASGAVPLAEAMAVATVDAAGAPAVRMVLLKRWDRSGFVFHTNLASRKAAALEATGRAALLWHWAPLGRQVRVEGTVSPVASEEVDAYFATRPRRAQIGSHASHQSAPIADRRQLDEAVSALEAAFEGRFVPRPPWWGGYRIAAVRFEFWQHREDRLHDRLQYDRQEDGGWRRIRLQP